MTNPISQTRREFLFSIPETAALVQLANGKDEDAARRTRIAIIGCGNFGEYLFHYLNREMGEMPREFTSEGISLVDIDTRRCDRLALRRKKAGLASTTCYSSLQRLLEAESSILGGVFICTPDSFHSRQCMACLEREIPVYCASPISLTSSDAENMIALSVAKKVTFYLENSIPTSPVYQFVKDSLLNTNQRKNLLGDIVSAHSDLAVQSPREWRTRCGYKRCPTVAEELALEQSVKEYGYKNLQEYREWPFSQDTCMGSHFLKLQESVLVYRMLIGEWPLSVYASADRDDGEGVYGMTFLLRYRGGMREFSVTVSTLSSDSLFGPAPLLLKDVVCATAGELTIYRNRLKGHSIARIAIGCAESDISEAKSSWSGVSTGKGCLGDLLDVDQYSKNDTQGYDADCQSFLNHARGIRNEWEFPENATEGKNPIFVGVDEFLERRASPAGGGNLFEGYASLRIAELAKSSLSTGLPVEIPSGALMPECLRTKTCL